MRRLLNLPMALAGACMRSLLSTAAFAFLAGMASIGSASSQEPGRIYKIGWLEIGTPTMVPVPIEEWSRWGAFREELRSQGFVAGKNLVIEARHARGDVARLQIEAEALVASGVDAIVTLGTPPTVAAMKATSRIPIVFAFVGDPLEKGLIANLSRPGGNVTGMATLTSYPKLWQLLHEVSPSTRRVGVVTHEQNRGALGHQEAAFRAYSSKRWREIAATVGSEYIFVSIHSLEDADSKMGELAKGGNAGIIINTDYTIFNWRAQIMEMALKHKLVSGCPQSQAYAKAGCLITYVEDEFAIPQGVGRQIVKILKGIKAGEIPVEEPTSGFKVIVNAKTAKALDIVVPGSVLAIADEVIE